MERSILQTHSNAFFVASCDMLNSIAQRLIFFTMPQFRGFKQALDREMKRLQAGGAGIEKKRALSITNEEEEKLIIIIK